MSVTILGALKNAKCNLDSRLAPQLIPIIRDQVDNGVTLLDKGYPLSTNVDQLLKKHGTLDAVPDFEE